MGMGVGYFVRALPLQTDEGSDTICIYLIILGAILIGLYLGLYLYNKMLVGKRRKQHPCRFCGHMVDAVSDCCSAPVVERFMTGKCTKCGKECKITCARCKRQLT
ncbi:MAG: hypothetical protein AYK23_00645 [Candidatus Proteinoplasmatales archaeon SG8-5]|nr:MAG: hypothetical protein AYK23_00645 [Candidatus Proteinoplasmatales archaeon SG8-5]